MNKKNLIFAFRSSEIYSSAIFAIDPSKIKVFIQETPPSYRVNVYPTFVSAFNARARKKGAKACS
jgi:hypothetical protein